MADTCRSCNAPILWAVTPKGKRAPLDAEPTKEGNIRLEERGPGATPIAHYLSGLELLAAQKAGELLHLSHFATCVDANNWRTK